MPSKKLFTLQEANSFVPQLLDLVPKIQKLSISLSNDFPDIKNAREKAKWNGGSDQGVGYLALVLKYNNFMRKIDEMGCEVKGIREGLVDFPSIREGKEVYLCWRMPEKEILFWHDLNTGFAGRKPI
ncbi:MAG: DUF2203 domain-containing protein [Nitrospinota bacterium]|nr:DUF2203 domain-containing protein [Nitrospinota bacterium]MED5354022.1 DUF2203 domain-containing protein [Nitrospinota bacterium]